MIGLSINEHFQLNPVFMHTISAIDRTAIAISELQVPVIHQYFANLNQLNFEAVANLFTAAGWLYPPFDRGICGRANIYQYLEAEASDLQAFPASSTVRFRKSELQSLAEAGSTVYRILGKVKTSYFTVNVGWSIEVSTDEEIHSVRVKLLAELQDLLTLKRG
jgi:hypothetical protein